MSRLYYVISKNKLCILHWDIDRLGRVVRRVRTRSTTMAASGSITVASPTGPPQHHRGPCNACLADSPLGADGRSARQRPDIYLDGCGTHLSFLSSSSLRPEPSRARALALSSPPYVDLPPPATKPRGGGGAEEDSSRGNLPRHLLHLPQTPRPASYGRNHPPPPPVAIGDA